MKQRIKSVILEYKGAKTTQSEKQKAKRIQKENEDSVSLSTSWGCWKERRESKLLKTYLASFVDYVPVKGEIIWYLSLTV